MHIALFGTGARTLARLYPRPALLIGAHTGGFEKALHFVRFPVSTCSVPREVLSSEGYDGLICQVKSGAFSYVHIEVCDTSWLRSHRPVLRTREEPEGRGPKARNCLTIENARLERAINIFDNAVHGANHGALCHCLNSLIFLQSSVREGWGRHASAEPGPEGRVSLGRRVRARHRHPYISS